MNEINIIENNKINSLFVRANASLIRDNQDILFEKDKDEYLKKLWLKTYNAILVKENNHWSKIQFLNSKSMTMFQLKWS